MKVVRLIFLTVLSILRQERNLVKQKVERHPPQLRHFVLLLLVLIITLTGCGSTLPKPLLYEPPPVSDTKSAAHVTIARERMFCAVCLILNLYLGRPKYNIELDGFTIAKLGSGQYTELFVNRGQHTIGGSCYYTLRPVGIPTYFVTGFEREWFGSQLSEEFIAGEEYKFLVSHAHPRTEQRHTMEVEKVQSFPKNISLDPSKLVLPGTKQDLK